MEGSVVEVCLVIEGSGTEYSEGMVSLAVLAKECSVGKENLAGLVVLVLVCLVAKDFLLVEKDLQEVVRN